MIRVLLKRYSELYNPEAQGKQNTGGRSDTICGMLPIGVMGINTSCVNLMAIAVCGVLMVGASF